MPPMCQFCVLCHSLKVYQATIQWYELPIQTTIPDSYLDCLNVLLQINEVSSLNAKHRLITTQPLDNVHPYMSIILHTLSALCRCLSGLAPTVGKVPPTHKIQDGGGFIYSKQEHYTGH